MSQEEEFTMIPKIIHYCWFGEGDKPRAGKSMYCQLEKDLPGLYDH